MSFARIWPLGCGFMEVLLSSQMTQLDLNMSKALDGATGGAYTLSSALDLSGSGLLMHSPIQMSGASAWLTMAAGSTLDMVSASTGIVRSGAGWGFYAGSVLDVAGTLQGSATLDLHVASGHIQWESGSSLVCAAGATANFQGPVAFQATSSPQLYTRMACSDAGRVTKRRISGADGDYTYQIAHADHIWANIVTANCAYTFSNTGAATGDEIEINVKGGSPTKELTIKNAGGTPIFSTAMKDAATFITDAVIVFNGTNWVEKFAIVHP